MKDNLSSIFAFEDDLNEEAKLCVVGVGGGGGNAVSNMVDRGIHGVEFVAINTDAQALAANSAPIKIQAGRDITKGLGAGARPTIGAEAFEESKREIEEALHGFDMVFITAGMGGGTGTGGAPVVAEVARKLGILTVAIVTKPFDCEGRRRSRMAEQGIDLLKQRVDTLIVIPNDRLLDMAEANTTLLEAFSRVDDVLYNATRGISDLITVHGVVNLDFADVKTTIQNGGTALMGAATCAGENRAERAAIEAITSPLLDGISIAGARNVLVNVTAGRSLGIREATAATDIIHREAGDDVEVIFGTVIDDAMGDELRVTVIATGFEREDEQAIATPGRPTRTIPLDDYPSAIPSDFYKGEDNLRRLDAPAFERRGLQTPEPQPPPHKNTSGTRVKRLNADQLRERDGRRRHDDDDKPAFLRKMMD